MYSELCVSTDGTERNGQSTGVTCSESPSTGRTTLSTDREMTTENFTDTQLALTSAALAGDAGGLYRIAGQIMDEGVAFDELLFEHLLPAERAIGSRWEQGDYLIAEEHAATAAIETVVSLMAGMFDRPEDGTPVVVTTAEGDDHSLPARASAAHLLFLGYRTTFLGSSVPGADLAEFLASDRPAVVVLSCAMTSHLLGARAVINAAHTEGIPVVVGGKGFGNDGRWAAVLGADRWVSHHSQVPVAIEDVIGEPLVDRPVTALPELLRSLMMYRSQVVATAESNLAAEVGEVDRRLREEIGVLLGATEAAVLVGGPEVVGEMLAWQRRALRAYGYDELAVARALKASLEQHGSNAVADLIDLAD